MKNLLIIPLILIVALGKAPQATAQKCSFAQNEKDRFTGSYIVRTHYKQIFVKFFGHHLAVGGSKVNQFMYLSTRYRGESVFSIRPDDKIMLLLDDETRMDLYPVRAEVSYSYGTYWQVDMDYSLPFLAREELVAKRIVAMRIYTSNGYIDYDLTPIQAKRIQDVLKCI